MVSVWILGRSPLVMNGYGFTLQYLRQGHPFAQCQWHIRNGSLKSSPLKNQPLSDHSSPQTASGIALCCLCKSGKTRHGPLAPGCRSSTPALSCTPRQSQPLSGYCSPEISNDNSRRHPYTHGIVPTPCFLSIYGLELLYESTTR